MIKVGEAKTRKNGKGECISFEEIGGICNMHHWLRGKAPLETANNSCCPAVVS